MDLKTYVCPNCGANTTNAQNCEYCGSLLVRFVEKGVDLSHTNYTNNLEVFPGLIEELKRNLKLQEENPSVLVSTDLAKVDKFGYKTMINIVSNLSWCDGTISPEFDRSHGKKQLCIVKIFDTYTDTSSPKVKGDNSRERAKLKRFKQLDSFPLFTAHSSAYTDDSGKSLDRREYAINFGEDAEGAARLVSEILNKVYLWSPTDPFYMFTNAGEENIKHARNSWYPYGDVAVDNSGCLGMIIAGLTVISASLALLF